MKKYEVIGFSVLVLITAVVVVVVLLMISDQYGEFEYKTHNGETGTATFCTVSHGQSRCKTDDGTTIMVEKYKKMRGGEE